MLQFVFMPHEDQGLSSQRYRVVPRVLIFLRRGEEVLLLKGAADKRLWANRYNGIGGHVERGESILSAAQRELLEETGLRCTDLRLSGVVVVDAEEKMGVLLFIFIGSRVKGTLKPSAEGTVRWVSRGELVSLPVVEDLPVLLEKAMTRQRGEPLFMGRSFYQKNGKLKVVFDG